MEEPNDRLAIQPAEPPSHIGGTPTLTQQHRRNGSADVKTEPFCMVMTDDRQTALSDAYIRDTVNVFPIKPDRISGVRGPYVEVRRASSDPMSNAVDISVTHHFRAHFEGDAAAACPALPALEAGCSAAGGASLHNPCTPRGPATLHIEELVGGGGRDSPPARTPASSPRHTTAFSPAPVAVRLSSGTDVSTIDSFAHDLDHLPLRSTSGGTDDLASPPSSPSCCPSSSWEIEPSQVHVGHRLAVGGFAEVFIGKYQGTLVAVKVLLLHDDIARGRFRKEVDLLASLRHPNLILFMGYTERPHLAIVSEFMSRGSLFKVLRKGGNVPLEVRLQRTVAVSVARGMAYLHSRSPPLLHLDLKSPNILVDDKWRIKIADFGLSRVRFSSALSGTGGGTPEWMAPEVLRSEKHDEGADVYSYGVVLWECLTGQPPWDGLHPMQVVGAVGFQGKSLIDSLPEDADPFLADLCRRCMAPVAALRPSFSQILEELEGQLAPGRYRHAMHSTLSEDDASFYSPKAAAARNAARVAEEAMEAPLPAPQLQRQFSHAEDAAFHCSQHNPPSPFAAFAAQQPFGSVAVDPTFAAAAAAVVAAEEQQQQVPAATPDAVEFNPTAAALNHLSLATPFAGLAPFADDSVSEEGERREVEAEAQATAVSASYTDGGTQDSGGSAASVESSSPSSSSPSSPTAASAVAAAAAAPEVILVAATFENQAGVVSEVRLSSHSTTYSLPTGLRTGLLSSRSELSSSASLRSLRSTLDDVGRWDGHQKKDLSTAGARNRKRGQVLVGAASSGAATSLDSAVETEEYSTDIDASLAAAMHSAAL